MMNRYRVERPPSCAQCMILQGLEFASCYVYSPAGSGAADARSRLLRTLLKDCDAHFMFKYAVRVRQQVSDQSPLSGFLSPNHALVPVPGSSPTAARGMTAAEQLAKALVAAGIGRSIWRGLYRALPVRKSSTAAPGSRPSVENHFDSFAIERAAAPPAQVVLVDDVITKGRTLLAAAARLNEAFPQMEIRAFALLRTMGLASGVDRLIEPCIGRIRWRAGDAYRTP